MLGLGGFPAAEIGDGAERKVRELVSVLRGDVGVTWSEVVLGRQGLGLGPIEAGQIGLGERARSVPLDDLVDHRHWRLGQDGGGRNDDVDALRTQFLDGQEDLMAVQYNPGQQYMLHCDGSCDGSPFVAGGRISTVLMYCATADGGGTAFPNANVHVLPQKGQAVYFHFRGQDGMMEDWHTEHSGCPVKAGEKWVVTQWIRDGVSKQHPHSRFDPSGGPIGVGSTIGG